MNIKIRDEQPEDIKNIEELTKAAFLNAEHSSHTEQFIVNSLRKHKQLTISLVATENDLIVGQFCGVSLLFLAHGKLLMSMYSLPS